MQAPGPHVNMNLERGPTAIQYRCDCGWAGTPRPYGDTTWTVHIEAIRHSSHHKVGGSPPGPACSPGGEPTNQDQEEEQRAHESTQSTGRTPEPSS